MNTTPPTEPPQPSPQPATTLSRAQATTLCAAGLVGCFFLPWLQSLLGRPFGFDLQQLGDEAKLLWLMPIFAILSLVAGFTGKSQRIAGQLAGATPFALLINGIVKAGSDLINILAPGAWLALVLGAILFLLVRR